ncbi:MULTISPECIES: hypothetical protein [Enterobacterales]|uniref:hypothetical protein n=1 Tax=Enterobacterales TaxID=91347 RepID=UPI0002833585|nr:MULTISPECIES: hypothetical protein [Enterobacterales]EKT9731988.1 hypothetical protein [Proteus mirabilis]EKA95897.1 hypothetical protein HMPREF1310_02830 [Proteus mirabilis WGLW4]EKW6741334.1 hypothetical protein [Proteus mirabilis]KNZ87554.1 hypothetical protein AFL46_03780 [Providencia stuartii]MBK0855518.1 hypothetical protein [Escherichia coli]
MGYTHYFTQKQSVDPLMWQNFRKHLDKLYHHYLANPISAEQICGGYPDKPIVLCDGLEENRLNDGSLFTDDGEALCFNGNAADDMNHETFIVQREIPVEDYWDFCKTAYKPYDVFVVAALLLLYNLCPGYFSVSSDGDIWDWQPVLDYVSQVFPYLILTLPEGIGLPEAG